MKLCVVGKTFHYTFICLSKQETFTFILVDNIEEIRNCSFGGVPDLLNENDVVAMHYLRGQK